VFGVPRGGAIVAGLYSSLRLGAVTHDPNDADVIVDDIADSGRTREHFTRLYPFTKFIVLVEKTVKSNWVHFPWEDDPQSDIEHSVTRILQFLGEDADRDGLRDTPARVVKSWKHLFGGYGKDPAAVLGTTFERGGYDQMVVLDNVEFYSHCEHHMMPFFGRAHLGYIPGPSGRVVGISKLARLVEVFSRRLQIQERLTQQIAQTLEAGTGALGVGVMLEAKHFCMVSRGVEKQNSVMRTSTLLGAFLKPQVRQEFFSLIERGQ